VGVDVNAPAEDASDGVGELGVEEGVDMVGGAGRRVVREGSLSIPEGNAGKRYRRGFHKAFDRGEVGGRKGSGS
jgi:hypothetical protein